MKILATLLLVGLLTAPALAKQVGELDFADRFDTLQARAQASQKMMVIKFYIDW